MNTAEYPLDVTVVMPTYNRAALVERALDSIRAQTPPVRHIVIVDDASLDGTPEVARAWARPHDQSLHVEVLPHNVGPAAARNIGIKLSQTACVAFLDSDDEYFPSPFERVQRLQVRGTARGTPVPGMVALYSGRRTCQ